MKHTSMDFPRAPQRRRRLAASWGLLLWLTVVWVFLWGEVTVANVVNGVIVAIVVTSVLALPATDFNGSFRPLGVIIFVSRFVWDVVRASLDVTRIVVRKEPPHGAVIRVRLRSHSDFYLTMTSGLTALVPGSVVVEAHRVTGTIYVHVLDVEMHGGLEQAHLSVLEQEERVLRAFGSREELLDAGLVPGSTSRAGYLVSRSGQRIQDDVVARRDTEERR
ncbi:Na+/H+ antiporter subunit E [Georgenia sp. MJ173]|uniref:Na+/H+ antiporter subunit E n=1 Tax=Georgenia sunbinii TaxID=3117728 RepID=UPI002F26273F